MKFLLIVLLFGILLTNGQLYQNSYQNNDYQARYNPQYANTNPLNQQQTQFGNPLLQSQNELQKQTADSGGGGIGVNNNQNSLNQNLNDVSSNFDSSSPYSSRPNYASNSIDPSMDESSFCPEHWISHRQTCYRFIKSPKRNWNDAKKICKAYNAYLVNIESTEKHAFILKQLILQNQKQNRFWISARQLGPNSWVNDDNSNFIAAEDSFSYEDHPIENEDLHDNRFLVTQNKNRYGTEQNFNYNQLTGNNRNRNVLINGQTYSSEYGPKDRLVYGYSRRNDKWMFMPSYDFEMNLFICESRQLFDPENFNLKNDDRRPFDYGLDVKDLDKIPRGPFFVRQPNDTTFDTSKTRIINDVTLSCLAGGYPTPVYRWFKEEYVNDTLKFFLIEPLKNDRYTLSGGNLIIYAPKQSEDQGLYHCLAENRFGRIRSESAQLNFGFIMEFNLKRSAETGEMNWGKSIFCDPPSHYPDVKYYWSRDYFPNFVEEDQRVFVSRDGALYFSSIESVDRANYSCTVQSFVSDTGRNGPFFQLRVHPNSNYQALIFANSFPKVFPEAPVAGEDIRLECVAFGYPIPTYNITRKGMPLQRNAYQTNYNRVLIIQNATVNDNGEYVCTISNPRKTIEKSIFINIQMKPEFTIPLKDKIKDYNSDVTFICESSAIPDVNYTWYKNAELLDYERLDKDRYTIQDNVMTIKYLDPEKDDGMYQCGATNQLKTAYSSAQLRVLSMKPSFKKRPLESEIYAIYNGNTTIVCDPEAAPRPKFQWKKDGNVIGSGGHRRILPSGTLVISPTSRDDEGIYTCVATNTGGTDESRARLIVLQELRFTQTPPPRITSQIHELIYLQCEVSYDEVLDVAFIWRHNGEVIRSDEDERIRVDRNRLTVHNITLLDAGDYECVVKSAVNKISSKTTVIVEGPPGAPGGVTVIEVGKTKALIEFVNGASNGRAILYYNILGRTNWNRTWTNVSTHVQAREIDRYTGRQQAEVHNLTPWSSYEFSVAAVNDLGIGTPSAPSPIYSTIEDKPYIAPRNVGGGGGKIGDLTITWEPLLPQEQNSHGIHYKVSWRLHGTLEWATQILKNQGNVGIAVVNIPLDKYYTQYDAKVQAINNVDVGPESEVVTIYSAEDMPQVAPQQPIALGFNSTALNVTWEPIEMTREKIRGKLIGHRLKYWKTVLAEEDSVYYLSRTTRNWALIVGLEPDTYYFVKVMAYNAAGEGPESERYIERTFRKAPQKPPSSVHVKGINPSTVRVVWRYVSPSQEEEPIQGFKVRVWESDQDMITANDTVIPIGETLEAYITNLTPGQSYKMRVLAFSNGGDGRMSSPTLRFQMGNTNARNSSQNRKLNYALFVGFLTVIYLNTRFFVYNFV
ncbi:contactin [Episyrphus balteatus]|uniref:contactin n=1 Tax=Episyrphus balteatus TaxID=286459 RepID=UPI0024865E1D|nr:contactin [Episyrphus balteatus]